MLRATPKITVMTKTSASKKPRIRVAVVESDPLRLVGFRALFEAEPEFELVAASLEEVSLHEEIERCCWAAVEGKTCTIWSPL
jgi:hypothetical protein